MTRKALVIFSSALLFATFAVITCAKIVLLSGRFELSQKRDTQYETFSAGKGGTLLGNKFRVEQGDDIEWLIFDESDRENWNARRPVKTYYDSGRVKEGSVIIHLPENKLYYIVFSNRYSANPNKVVCAHVIVGTSEEEIKRTLADPICPARKYGR